MPGQTQHAINDKLAADNSDKTTHANAQNGMEDGIEPAPCHGSSNDNQPEESEKNSKLLQGTSSVRPSRQMGLPALRA
ncbi:hypothetical protein APE01nite_15200 [Acetobacter peroxydans]|uniref:Uncharacterized protein n=1 Tax=Acetobacter peroxydans TaxID=104098 RepID=A0A4Y3TVB2_9PROT|nr:hypothetical protein AA13755_1104 [Acetobacter peroxydans NBRC 13755]GBR42974.1 hypothetical protein AA0475_1673 [Acetobacter peroxydans]GEB85723.1 hypothetical protein APE01nite_15200 [Acetobacter peroxydans]